MRSRFFRCSLNSLKATHRPSREASTEWLKYTHLGFDSGRLKHAAEESSVDGGNDAVGEMLQHARREHELHVYVTHRYEHFLHPRRSDEVAVSKRFKSFTLIGENGYLNL